MNIVIVPLIGPQEDAWFSPTAVSLSHLDNFCRVFMPPPGSETRKKANGFGDQETEEASDGDQGVVVDSWHPNGFLVVDSAGEALRRIGLFMLKILATRTVPESGGAEAKLLKLWARLFLARRPIPTVRRMETVVPRANGDAGATGAETATELANALNGHCDAVIAFEEDASLFKLRARVDRSTRVTDLYHSGDLNVLQDRLRATWHWDRDSDDHCTWLGVTPPDLERRNERIIGATLMFESHITIADQYIGKSLCDDLIYDRYWIDRGHDEYVVFQNKWGPVWLESLGFILAAWMKSASDCGNTQPRTCTVRTAAHPNDWRDVLWFFIAKAERFLSKCLGGEVQFDIRAQPVRKLTKQELHPRYIFASTRAIQSDRGFDLIDRQRQPTFRYAEITSRTIYEARHSRNVWIGSNLIAIPRCNLPDTELVWMPTMTTRLPSPATSLPGDQADGSRAL